MVGREHIPTTDRLQSAGKEGVNRGIPSLGTATWVKRFEEGELIIRVLILIGSDNRWIWRRTGAVCSYFMESRGIETGHETLRVATRGFQPKIGESREDGAW